MNRQNVDLSPAHSYNAGFGMNPGFTTKLNTEPKTNKSKRTSEWHLETTDYAGWFHWSLQDIQLSWT